MLLETRYAYGNLQKNKDNTEMYAGYQFPAMRGQVSVRELAESWLADIRGLMRPSAYARYRDCTEQYILPYTGDMPACGFDRDALSALLGFLSEGRGKEPPLSRYTLYLLESMVHAMFSYGAGKRLVPAVSFGKVGYKPENRKDAMPLAGLEMAQLLNEAEKRGNDLQVQVLLPLYAGLGLSEVCGLKWGDIDLGNGKIHIHRNLMRVKRDRTAGASTIMAECELPEGMCRSFVMPERLLRLLQTVEKERKPSKDRYVAEPGRKAGRGRKISAEAVEVFDVDRAEDGSLVEKGSRMTVLADPRTLQYRLKTIGEKAGIQGLTFQILRDTFAVLCLDAGGDVYSLAYLLGVNMEAVCDRYEPWMERKEEFLKRIG